MAYDAIILRGRMFRWVVSGALLLATPSAFAQEVPQTDSHSQIDHLRALAEMDAEAGAVVVALKLIPAKGAPGDPARGMKMLRTLSDQGNLTAMVVLSAFLGDTAESNRLLLRVATSPSPSIWRAFAASSLGVNYRDGRGVTKDGDAAIKWFRAAAEAGDERGMTFLAVAYVQGDHVPKDMTQAARWLKSAAEKGERSAITLLAAMYRSGEGVTKDPVRALELFEAAAKKGSVAAAFGAATMLLSANPPDPARALPFVQMAAEKNDPKGMGLLGTLYRHGVEGLPKDLTQSAYWSRRSAEANEPSAMMTMVAIFAESTGAIVTQEEGLKWLEAAAALDNVAALRMLGHSYENGFAPYVRDMDKALGYYRRAAARGDVESRETLARLGTAPTSVHAP